ncbi:hypothetical protein COOONC_23333, partial [Cooperia oncophora]
LFWIHYQTFRNVVSKRSSGIEDVGAINWSVFFALLVLNFIVFLVLIEGYKYIGKIGYLTSTAPYLIIIALFIRGITLEGAGVGVYHFLGKPDMNKLLKREVSTNMEVAANLPH